MSARTAPQHTATALAFVAADHVTGIVAFAAPSTHDAGRVNIVALDTTNGDIYCTCKGAECGRRCWHVEHVRAAWLTSPAMQQVRWLTGVSAGDRNSSLGSTPSAVASLWMIRGVLFSRPRSRSGTQEWSRPARSERANRDRARARRSSRGRAPKRTNGSSVPRSSIPRSVRGDVTIGPGCKRRFLATMSDDRRARGGESAT